MSDNLRDEIAVKVLLIMVRGVMGEGSCLEPEEYAIASYRIADAMLKERAK